MAIQPEFGVQLEPHQIVLRPLVTEKGTHVSARHNAYAFEVHRQATKVQIREAVETLWGVRVEAVRTQTRVGKPRRTRSGLVHAPDWKRAIVKLHEEDRISFF